MKIRVKSVENLKQLLLIKGFTQRSLGRAIGICEAYANQIVNGTRNPGPEIAKNVCDKLNCSFEDLFYVEKNSKSKQGSSDFFRKEKAASSA